MPDKITDGQTQGQCSMLSLARFTEPLPDNDIACIAFIFNGGQSPASNLSPICTKICMVHLSIDTLYDQILPPCNYCHHPWCVGGKCYHKALLIMFSCAGMPDHASWNEVFHFWDTKLSWFTYTMECTLFSSTPPVSVKVYQPLLSFFV